MGFESHYVLKKTIPFIYYINHLAMFTFLQQFKGAIKFLERNTRIWLTWPIPIRPNRSPLGPDQLMRLWAELEAIKFETFRYNDNTYHALPSSK